MLTYLSFFLIGFILFRISLISMGQRQNYQFEIFTYITFAGILAAILGNKYAEGLYLNEGIGFGRKTNEPES